MGISDSRFVGSVNQPFHTVTPDQTTLTPEAVVAATTSALKESADAAQFIFLNISAAVGYSPMAATIGGSVENQVIEGLHNVMSSIGPDRTVIVLLPAMLPDKDLSRVVIDPWIHAERVILVSDDGRSTLPTFAGDEYRELISRLREAPINSLRQKLIRRQGWFRREIVSGGHRYFRTLFDCSRSVQELQQLLLESIKGQHGSKTPDVVLYDPGPSKWIRNPLAAACVALGLDDAYDVGLREGRERLARAAKRWRRARRAVIVVPFIDTGDTTVALAEWCETAAPIEVDRVVAVLSTAGGSRDAGFRRLRRSEPPMLRVDYFLRVEQDFVETTQNDCYPETLGVPESDVNDDPTGPLSVYEFWDLAIRAGVYEERDVPPHRASVGVIPNFHFMIKEHGQWLSHRLWSMVSDSVADSAQSTILVCPQEESEDPASSTLANHMRNITGAEVVKVPRRDIERVVEAGESATALVEELWAATPPWSVELMGASSEARVCLLDDFVSSGATIDALREIVEFSGRSGRPSRLKVLAVCCIANFDPSARTRHVIALYEWQRKSSQS